MYYTEKGVHTSHETKAYIIAWGSDIDNVDFTAMNVADPTLVDRLGADLYGQLFAYRDTQKKPCHDWTGVTVTLKAGKRLAISGYPRPYVGAEPFQSWYNGSKMEGVASLLDFVQHNRIMCLVPRHSVIVSMTNSHPIRRDVSWKTIQDWEVDIL